MVDLATRNHPLSGKIFGGTGVSVTPAPSVFRCSLRVGAKSVSAVSKALNIELPREPKTSTISGDRIALWIGPDEWLIIDTKNNPCDDLAKSKASHSAVDVSHRNTAMMVSGAQAADVINAGCPQDLSLDVFPVGGCSRTILGKIEIVLYRPKQNVFRVECWRSFSAYAFDLLSTAARQN